MTKSQKVIVTVIILVALFGAGFTIHKLGWFDKTETAEAKIVIPEEGEPVTIIDPEKEQMKKDMKKLQEQLDQMKQDEADGQVPPANQIATPVAPANPADSTTAVIPVQKKKSGAGG